ncbi:MAG: lysylphosphatidylglycerol synthase transmembrane domain-containing protein [Candidatus Zapsychrus exili]|nr:lysylphosphatidylglycerol synthase transmembrane domain-containing protein [Candidatus Zapsychrus exili]
MQLGEKTKNVLSFFMRIACSALLLFYLFKQIDIEGTINVIKSANMIYILYAGIVFLFINVFLLYRWVIYIRALDLSVKLSSVTRYFLAGLFGNLFLPSAIGGDLIKIIGLCKNSDKKPTVVASVLLDRLSGFIAIVLVAITAFTLGYNVIDDKTLLFPIVILGIVFFGFITVLFNERAYSFACKIFNKFPKIKNNLMELHYDIALLKNKKREGWKAIALSCLCQVIFSFTFYLTAKALHQDINIIYFLIFVPLICVAGALPSIGGLGAREAGAAFLFAKIGVESGIAVSISLVNFLFMVIVGIIGGIIYALGSFKKDS